jgi:hypothetical protein
MANAGRSPEVAMTGRPFLFRRERMPSPTIVTTGRVSDLPGFSPDECCVDLPSPVTGWVEPLGRLVS